MEGKRLLTRRDRITMAAQRPLINLRKGIKKLIVGEDKIKPTIVELEQRLELLNKDIQSVKKLLAESRDRIESPPDTKPVPLVAKTEDPEPTT